MRDDNASSHVGLERDFGVSSEYSQPPYLYQRDLEDYRKILFHQAIIKDIFIITTIPWSRWILEATVHVFARLT